MNDRLRELALQVDLMRYPSDGINIKIEKFAELIVKECIDIAYREGDNVAYLALHFGVDKD